MQDLDYEASCLNCKFWQELPRSNPKDNPKRREGVCQGKYNGDYVNGNQYCLGFKER